MGTLGSPVSSTSSTDSGEQSITPAALPGFCTKTSINKEDSASLSPKSHLRAPLPSIEEDPEEDDYSVLTSSFSPGVPSYLSLFSSSQANRPTPNPVQTLLEHLKEIGQNQGIEGEAGSWSGQREEIRTQEKLEETKPLSLSRTNTKTKPLSFSAEGLPSGTERKPVTEPQFTRDMLGEMNKEIDDLMASLSDRPQPLVEDQDRFQSGEGNSVRRRANEAKGRYAKPGLDHNTSRKMERCATSDSIPRKWVGETGERESWATVLDDLKDFFNANRIEDGQPISDQEGNRCSRSTNSLRADSDILSMTATSKEKRRMAVHIRGGAGDSDELIAHLQGIEAIPTSKSEPNMRGGGPLEVPFIPRKGSRRNPPFVPRPRPTSDEQSERSTSPSIKSSNRTSLRDSLINAEQIRNHTNDNGSALGDEEGSIKDTASYVSSYTSDHDRFGGKIKDLPPARLSLFPSPPNSPGFIRTPTQRVPPSPKWNSESETEIATPTMPTGKKSLNSRQMTIPESEWESELDIKGKSGPSQSNTVGRIDRSAATQNPYSALLSHRPERSNTIRQRDIGVAITADTYENQPSSAQREVATLNPISPASPQVKPPYPPSVNSLQGHDYEREPRMGNPQPVPFVAKVPRLHPAPQTASHEAHVKNDPWANQARPETPVNQGNEYIGLRSENFLDLPTRVGFGLSSPGSPVPGFVRGKGLDPRTDLGASQSSSPKLDSPWTTPVQKNFSLGGPRSPANSDIATESLGSDASTSTPWSRKGHKNYKITRVAGSQGRNFGGQGALDGEPSRHSSNKRYDKQVQDSDPSDSEHTIPGEGKVRPHQGRAGYDRNRAALKLVGIPEQDAGAFGNPTSPRIPYARLGYGSDIGPGDSISEVTTRGPAISQSEEPFESVSQKGGFQGHLAEEGRLPSVHELDEVDEARREMTQEERNRVLMRYKKQQDDWKRDQDRLRQEYLQEMKNVGKAPNADFEEKWKLRAHAAGAEVKLPI